MAIRTPAQLRELAVHFREIASMGDDHWLRSALQMIADEFEREAEVEFTDSLRPTTVSGQVTTGQHHQD
jgi:hypothetical protein